MPTKVPTNTLTEIEMAGAARQVGDDQRHHHAEHRSGHAVEQLHDDQHCGLVTDANRRPRIGSAAKPISSNGRRPQICARLADPRRQSGDDKLRHDDAGGDQDCRPAGRAHGDDAAHQRQHGRIGEVKQQQAAGEDQERPVVHQLAGFARRLGARSRRRAVRALGIDLRCGRSRAARAAPEPAAGR